ncbi:MAG: glutaredoxin [Gammaproteobacteria bacterium]|nr:glutaredoxin [Gammaproteobacteria bacterium]
MLSGVTERLSLYYSETCWYCARVRQTSAELGISLELRDIDRDPKCRAELVAGGGKSQVPCLKIESGNGDINWMYESADIAAFLTSKFKSE